MYNYYQTIWKQFSKCLNKKNQIGKRAFAWRSLWFAIQCWLALCNYVDVSAAPQVLLLLPKPQDNFFICAGVIGPRWRVLGKIFAVSYNPISDTNISKAEESKGFVEESRNSLQPLLAVFVPALISICRAEKSWFDLFAWISQEQRFCGWMWDWGTLFPPRISDLQDLHTMVHWLYRIKLSCKNGLRYYSSHIFTDH